MNLIKPILSIIILIIAFASHAQVINVFEKDRDGKHLNKDRTPKKSYKNNKVVDINSILEIELDKAKIVSQIETLYPTQLPADMAKKISLLRAAIEKRNDNLSKITEVVNRYNYEAFKKDPNALKLYAADLQTLSQSMVDIFNIDSRIKQRYIQLKGGDMYERVYTAAAYVLNHLESEVDSFVKDKGFYFQFGGWLHSKNKNTALHFPGFDDIAPQPHYEVNRWQFLPTKEQVDELEKLKSLAQENKDSGLNILKVMAEKRLDAIKSFAITNWKQKYDSLKLEVTKVESAATAPVDAVKTIFQDIKNLDSDIKQFNSEIESRLKYYESIFTLKDFQITQFLAQAKSDIDFISKEEGPKLLNKMKQIESSINNLDDVVLNSTGEIKSAFIKFTHLLSSDIDLLAASAKQNIDNILLGKPLDVSALKFGEKVYKLAFASLPEKTDLDLYDSGIREEGDRIVLKMMIMGQNKKENLLDSKEIYLFKVLPHIETTAGIVFADPFKSTSISTDFQMAPSYNILFKGFLDEKRRRKSVVYNRIVDWGFGLHISAPDFNKDDVPELGAGIVVSTLNDYVQTGVAYNIFEGVPYWFFGLRMPFPTLNSSTTEKN